MLQKKKRRYPEFMALKGRIREQKTSYRKLSARIGMATNTLSDKINGHYVFDAAEIEKICCELDISSENVAGFFFPKMLRNATQ